MAARTGRVRPGNEIFAAADSIQLCGALAAEFTDRKTALADVLPWVDTAQLQAMSTGFVAIRGFTVSKISRGRQDPA